MKKIIYLIITIIVIIIGMSSCTQNQRARAFGSDLTIKVPNGKKVMMATWKGESLFYMVEDMEEDYVPQRKELIESSNYGIMEGHVFFIESR